MKTSTAIAALILGLLSSCEDKAQVAENQKLLEQIPALEKQVAHAELSAGENPGDLSGAIADTGKRKTEVLAEIDRLKETAGQAQADRTALEKAYKAYKAKYPIR